MELHVNLEIVTGKAASNPLLPVIEPYQDVLKIGTHFTELTFGLGLMVWGVLQSFVALWIPKLIGTH